MNAIAWLLVLVIVLGGAALIVIALLIKNKDAESHPIPAPSFKPVTDQPAAQPRVSGDQVMIYEYYDAYPIRRCAVCDSENDAAETYCYVCGQILR